MKSNEFNGQRFKDARIYRGLTIRELADKINVTHQMISLYENNKSTPSPESLINIENALGFPRIYFYQDDEEKVLEGTTFFRALLSSTKKSLASQNQRVLLLAKLHGFLIEYIDFPALNLPQIEHSVCPEVAAKELREFWGLGEEPIGNIIHLLERNGFVLSTVQTNGSKIDAFGKSIEIDGEENYYIVLANDKKSAVRRQFDAAHELGHAIMHDKFEDLTVLTRDEFKDMESEAHQFAAAFLLPEEAFKRDLIDPTKLELYIDLKKKWKVSISAMVVRSRRLDLISHNQYQYMMKKISKNGWKTREPLDDVIPVSKPTILRQAIEVIFENELLNKQSFFTELQKYGLSMRREEVEDILNLPTNMLKPEVLQENVISLRSKRDRK